MTARPVHWREAAIDGLLLGLFMLSAGGFGTLLYAPSSPLAAAWPPIARDLAMGLAMGATAVAIIYSRPGQRSGAHLNPAVTVAFLRLGKIERRDALAYLVAQAAGGVLGVLVVGALLGSRFTGDPVRSVVTVPGRWGAEVAFAAEVGMTFVLFLTVLVLSNRPRWARFTGVVAGAWVALFIAFEAPVSGMSLNPARTFASALPSGIWDAFWVYLTAPVVGMLGAAELYRRWPGAAAVLCAKLHHTDRHECVFRCGYCRHRTEEPGIQLAISGETP